MQLFGASHGRKNRDRAVRVCLLALYFGIGTAGVLIAAACGGGGGPGDVTPSKATPTPRPTPTVFLSNNYYPYLNTANYEGGTATGGSNTIGPVVLGTPSAKGPGKIKDCSESIGGAGTQTSSISPILIPYSSPQTTPAGASPLLVIGKNPVGDVYVAGYVGSPAGNPTCVSLPYPIAMAGMTKGQQWTFTDIFGVSQTATVVSDHQTATFTVAGSGPHHGVSSSYSSAVTTVTYVSAADGSTQTIAWAAGYGPVQVTNTAKAASSARYSANPWTAFGITIPPVPPQ